jgi:hypothetical protein
MLSLRVVYDAKVSTSGSEASVDNNRFIVDLGHDFFEPQPIKDAAVFFLRYIAHNWPDGAMKRVLKQLRESAQPTTRLLIMDWLVSYAAPNVGAFPDIPGSESPPVPKPLLANLGIVGGLINIIDLQVCWLR